MLRRCAGVEINELPRIRKKKQVHHVFAGEICSKCLIKPAKALLIVKQYSFLYIILLPFIWFTEFPACLEKLIESEARTSASIAIQLDILLLYMIKVFIKLHWSCANTNPPQHFLKQIDETLKRICTYTLSD
jgi:hypothetical protein